MPANLRLLPEPPIKQTLKQALDGVEEALEAIDIARELNDEDAGPDTITSRHTIRRIQLKHAYEDAIRLKARLSALHATKPF